MSDLFRPARRPSGDQRARRGIHHARWFGLWLYCAASDKWDRKNYFYPDLPQGLSNLAVLMNHSAMVGEWRSKSTVPRRTIGLTRIHLEEDAGKNTHVSDAHESRVDLNRAGVPLMEIVSEPDMRTPSEAVAYLRMLRLIMLYLEVSDCTWRRGHCAATSTCGRRPRGSQS